MLEFGYYVIFHPESSPTQVVMFGHAAMRSLSIDFDLDTEDRWTRPCILLFSLDVKPGNQSCPVRSLLLQVSSSLT